MVSINIMRMVIKMNEIMKIDKLSKSFTIHNLNKHIEASKNINISLKKGEFVGITGKVVVVNLQF